MEKRKPTANDAADCIDMMLSRHVTVKKKKKKL